MRDEQKQKKWFLAFAVDKSFDPLKPANWYACQRLDYLSVPVFVFLQAHFVRCSNILFLPLLSFRLPPLFLCREHMQCSPIILGVHQKL
jgi:hypothetical protein